MKTQALYLLIALAIVPGPLSAQEQPEQTDLDARVRRFLDEHRRSWRDANVPMADGQALYDVIVEKGYTRALEIGTSTGHSAIWIAWALSKTGGKLITIEIDRGRHQQALQYVEEAGLSEYIDARLADAHELVPALPGPFDFVFLDADKEGQVNYFHELHPRKLAPGGLIAVHNAIRQASAMRDYLDLVRAHSEFDTVTLSATLDDGFCLSYRRRSA